MVPAKGHCLCGACEFTAQVWVDSGPDSCDFASKTHMMTEADVKKAFDFEGDA